MLFSFVHLLRNHGKPTSCRLGAPLAFVCLAACCVCAVELAFSDKQPSDVICCTTSAGIASRVGCGAIRARSASSSAYAIGLAGAPRVAAPVASVVVAPGERARVIVLRVDEVVARRLPPHV